MRPELNKIKLGDLSSEEFLKLVEEASPDELMEISQLSAPAPQKKQRRQRNEKNASGETTVRSREFIEKILAVPEGERGLFSILLWWELRRLLYNGLLLVAMLPAMLCLLVRFGFDSIVLIPMIASIFFLVMANVCYTSGWLSEYIARRCFGAKATYFGSILFALGTGFSMVLTLLYTLLMGGSVAIGGFIN